MRELKEIEKLYCPICKDFTPHTIHGFEGDDGNRRHRCECCGEEVYEYH